MPCNVPSTLLGLAAFDVRSNWFGPAGVVNPRPAAEVWLGWAKKAQQDLRDREERKAQEQQDYLASRWRRVCLRLGAKHPKMGGER